MTDSRLDLGRQAEVTAEKYLTKKGYRLIERNYRCALGEIDLVMEDGETLVFVEVKGGRVDPDFSPMDHLDDKKRRKLLMLGKLYLCRFKGDPNVRFDLVTVTKDGPKFHIDHVEDVVQDPFP